MIVRGLAAPSSARPIPGTTKYQRTEPASHNIANLSAGLMVPWSFLKRPRGSLSPLSIFHRASKNLAAAAIERLLSAAIERFTNEPLANKNHWNFRYFSTYRRCRKTAENIEKALWWPPGPAAAISRSFPCRKGDFAGLPAAAGIFTTPVIRPSRP